MLSPPFLLLGRLGCAAMRKAFLALASPPSPPPRRRSDAHARAPLRQPVAVAGRRRACLKLSPDGRFATLLRNRADDRDRYDLWAVDTATGAARMLVDSARLGTGAAALRGGDDAARAGRGSPACAASSTTIGRPTAARSWCRSTATSISPASTAMSAGSPARPRPSSTRRSRAPAAISPSSATRISM